jgi:hypothetical protein
MAKARYYPLANTTAQNFASAWPGVIMPSLRVLVLHTTETSGWPGYSGGASAPTFTAYPDTVNKKLVWRQHFPLDMSCRALRNDPGGVNTNTTGTVQIELVGTSDSGGPGMFWPNAPDWALQDLADFCVWLRNEWGVPCTSTVRWVAYPASYGFNASQRLQGSDWLNYRGILGHQHVAENDHGDPGLFPIARLLQFTNTTPTEEFVLATKDEVKAALYEVLRDNPALIGRAVHKQQLFATVQSDGTPLTVGHVLNNNRDNDDKLAALAAKVDELVTDVAALKPTQPTV